MRYFVFILIYLICFTENVTGQYSFSNGNYLEQNQAGQWGIRNTTEEWLISPCFENEKVEIIDDKYAIVKYKRRFGVINHNGTWQIEPKYEEIIKDKEIGYWRIYLDRDVGVIFPNWEIIEPKYSDVWVVCNGIVKITKGSKFGFAFENGIITEPLFNLRDETSIVFRSDCYKFAINRQYGLVFPDGTLVSPKYTEIVFYNKEKSIIAVKNDDQYYFVDFKGNPISNYKFDRIRNGFDENGFCLVIKDNKYGYMRDDGFLIEPIYVGITEFENEKAIAWLTDEEKIIIDTNGHRYEDPNKQENKEDLYAKPKNENAEQIIYAFTNYAFWAEQGSYEYYIDISTAEMDKKGGLVLKGKITQYAYSAPLGYTPQHQLISMATGNRVAVGVYKQVFRCSKEDLDKEWIVLETQSLPYMKIRSRVEKSHKGGYNMRNRIVIKGEDCALVASNRGPF